MEQGKNYQPVMIRTLNQNNGKATKDKIIEELHNANSDFPKNYFSDSPVFKVLENRSVVKYDDVDKTYYLLDYETYTPAEKAHITMKCDEKIKNPFNLKINILDTKELATKFLEWLNSEKTKEDIRIIENEKNEVKELMKKLELLDKSSIEFTDLVLYGLLPYSNTKYAKRVSRFPVFLNIKTFLKSYEYTEDDWKNIANRIYDLIHAFQKEPDNIRKQIQEFTSNKKYTRMLQCGSISPMFFCINDSYPVINNKIIRTYRDFSQAFGWGDKMSQKLTDYVDNIEKCNKLIEFLQIKELESCTNFDLFCWWYDEYQKEESDEKIEDNDDEEEEEPSKVEIENIEFDSFLSTLNLEDYKKFAPHALRNPERIKIREIIQNASKGKWQLPNFQRYFDWTKTDIRDLLESIFNDYYIGAFLLWENEGKPPLKTMEIEGVKVDEDVKIDMIILDGQQRITSLYYAIRPSEKPTKKIRKPVYYYINFAKFLKGIDENIIEVLEEKLSKEESIHKLLFPIYEMEKYDEWIDAFEDSTEISSESNNKLKDVRRIIEKKIKHFIDGFEIPYVSLPPSMELNQVTYIFERINTKGKTLTAFDLLIATLNLYDIDLRRLWDDAERNYPKLKSYNSRDKLPIYILQSMALSYHPLSQCSRQDILKIYKTVFQTSDVPFEDAWEEAVQYVNKAILKLENLRDGYGVKNRKALPYLPTIPILASLLKEIDGVENKIECLSKLDKWYWTSVFSEHYSSGVDGKLTADFREMQFWFRGQFKTIKVVENFYRQFGTALNLREIKRENNAIYRGILSMLALQGAPDFNTNLTLENAPNNDKHHIFPKDSFKKYDTINSILNMTWLSDDTNRKIIRAEKPSIYIKKFIEEKYGGDLSKFQNNMSKHFITEKAYQHLIKDDFMGFIEEREITLRNKIADMIGLKQSDSVGTLLTPNTPFDNELIVEETFQKCDEYIHWVDKFFRVKGLKWISRYVPKDNVKEIKILTSIDTANEELRDRFKALKKQMSNDNVSFQMRVVVDNKLKSAIHGRWLITKNDCFTFQSVDTVARGAYDEIRGGATKPPFDEWWNESLDIIEDWSKIKENDISSK